MTDAELNARFDRLESLLQKQISTRPAAATADVATDKELDSEYGDPLVRFDPRDWKGSSHKGEHYSKCPPDFLALTANALDYFAARKEKNGEADKAEWDRRDARRARGWAKRNAAMSALTKTGEGSDGIPF